MSVNRSGIFFAFQVFGKVALKRYYILIVLFFEMECISRNFSVELSALILNLELRKKKKTSSRFQLMKICAEKVTLKFLE